MFAQLASQGAENGTGFGFHLKGASVLSDYNTFIVRQPKTSIEGSAQYP